MWAIELRRAVRALGLLAATGSTATLVGACGEASRRVSAKPSTRSSVTTTDKDRDYDSRPNARYDSDDYRVLDYGREATQRERLAVVDRVRAYYAAAAREDGTAACAMLSKPSAEATILIYDREAPSGTTCATVAKALFRREHAQLAVDNATMEVESVRLGARLGYALLNFKSRRDRHMLLYREAGIWKVDAAVDSEFT